MFCVVQARLAEKSASPETPAPKKRRKSTTSKQGRSPSAAGVNLLILTQSVPQGGIVGKLNLFIVPEIVARFGLRWHSAVINPSLQNLIRHAIVSHNIGGYGPRYEELYEENPEAELKMVQKLRASHAHTIRKHRERLATTVSQFFLQTTDPVINWAKEKVFHITDGGPLLPDSHPVMAELLEAAPNGITRLAVPSFHAALLTLFGSADAVQSYLMFETAAATAPGKESILLCNRREACQEAVHNLICKHSCMNSCMNSCMKPFHS